MDGNVSLNILCLMSEHFMHRARLTMACHSYSLVVSVTVPGVKCIKLLNEKAIGCYLLWAEFKSVFIRRPET